MSAKVTKSRIRSEHLSGRSFLLQKPEAGLLDYLDVQGTCGNHQIVIVIPILAAVVLYFISPAAQRAVAGVNIPYLVGLQATRVAGGLFILLHAAGRLSNPFAAAAGGWGDLLAAGRYDLLDDQVTFLEGWFSDTLPAAPIETIAVLLLDGDLYGSTTDALSVLYPKVSKGGFVIVDDYGWHDNCRRAVDEFRVQNEIREPLMPIEDQLVLWRRAQ